MENAKRIRIVKRSGGAAERAEETAGRMERETRRETREVVSDWVRDHRRRAEEFRENYSALLDSLGFSSPLSCRTTGA